MNAQIYNNLINMINHEQNKLISLNEINEISYLYLKGILKEYDNFYKKNELVFINTFSNDYTKNIFEFLGEHFKNEFDNLDKEIINDVENGSNYDKLDKVFELIELIKSNKNINSNIFFDLCGIDRKHPLISSFDNLNIEKKEFLSEIVSNIKEWKKSGKSLLYSIEKFRMSPDGLKAITRKSNNKLENDLLEKLINSFQQAERAEIFVRIEKYIKSGWFDFDNPLQDYYLNKDDADTAIYKLKTAMGKRFFEAEVKKNQLGKYFDYELILNEDNKLEDKIFSLAQSKIKDYCIKGVDGKIYLGDTTTDTIGYMNGNSWISTLKAIDNYKKINTEIDVEYSVSLKALFYDGETKDSMKKKFSEKFDNFTMVDINDWHLMQFLAVLDRDSQDFGYDLKKLIKEVKLNLFGSTSEGYCNTVLNLNDKDFFDEVFSSINRILNNFNKQDVIFNAQGMRTNVESIPIHLLTATIKGFEKLINNDEVLIKKYCELSNNIENLSEKIVNSGHINEELSKLYQRLWHPEDIQKMYLKGKSVYDKDKDELIKLREERKEEIKKNAINVNNLINSYINMIDDLYQNSKQLINCQKSSWACNYNDAFNNLILGLKSFEDINSNYKSWIEYNKTTIDKKDKSLKKLLSNVINTINNSYGKDSLVLIDNIKTTIYDIEKFLLNIPNLDGEFFETYNNLNTQNQYTLHGRFIYEQLNSENREDGFIRKENYYKNMEKQLIKSLDDFKSKLEIYENNKFNDNKFKISM